MENVSCEQTSIKSDSNLTLRNTFIEKSGFKLAEKNSHTGSDDVSPDSSLCRICGDKALGYHYGVLTCESCKIFFRQSINKQIEYHCFREGKCWIFLLNRNRCQYCRLKKCLSVGMNRNFKCHSSHTPSKKPGSFELMEGHENDIEKDLPVSSIQSDKAIRNAPSAPLSVGPSVLPGQNMVSVETNVSQVKDQVPVETTVLPDKDQPLENTTVLPDEVIVPEETTVLPGKDKEPVEPIVLSDQDEVPVEAAVLPGEDKEAKRLAIHDIILSISLAHHQNCPITDEKIKNIGQRQLFALVPKSMPHLEDERISAFQNFSSLLTPLIQTTVVFAKHVPCFSELLQQDQLVLLKSSFFEIWLSSHAKMFDITSQTITFYNGSLVIKSDLCFVYEMKTVDKMFSFAQLFTQLDLNDTEIGLFIAILLLTPSRSGLSDVRTVSLIHERLLEVLSVQLAANHPRDNHSLNDKLMDLTKHLQQINSMHHERLSYYQKRAERIQVAPLLSEMFDLSTNYEEL